LVPNFQLKDYLLCPAAWSQKLSRLVLQQFIWYTFFHCWSWWGTCSFQCSIIYPFVMCCQNGKTVIQRCLSFIVVFFNEMIVGTDNGTLNFTVWLHASSALHFTQAESNDLNISFKKIISYLSVAYFLVQVATRFTCCMLEGHVMAFDITSCMWNC
jgi:hypothetical protein